MAILKWQKNDLAMTQEVIPPECVSCVDREGEKDILEYIVVVGLRLSTKGDDLKKKKDF